MYICDHNSGKSWWILIILHIWKREWIPSASTLFTYLVYLRWRFDATVTFVTSICCDSVCCMCGEVWAVADWWHSWLMTNQLACLCSCQWWTFWTYLVTVNLFSLYLMNFISYTTLDAMGNNVRVHYKSMKCDVSFSEGSVSMLFKWGEHIIRVCVKMFFLLTASSAKIILKIKRVFPELWSQMYCYVFMNHSVYSKFTEWQISVNSEVFLCLCR